MGRITEHQRQETREKLLWAAADEFAAHGVAGANINRISIAAGLAKGTVYNYFASKDALFLEVIRAACAAAAAELTVEPTLDTRACLVRMLEIDVEWAQKHEAFSRVLLRETMTSDPARYQAVLEAYAPFLEKIQSILERGQARGDVRTDLPAPQLALAFSGLTQVAYVQHWGTGGAWPTFAELPTLVTKLFLEGASPENKGRS